MKAEELMVGDWVCTEHDAIPRQIDWIRTGEVGLLWNKVVTPPYLVPIPLTPEILEKNGFELGGVLHNTYSVGDSNYTITIGKYGRGQCDIMNHLFHIGVTMECCGTVHELQHALRLCGIEKEIKI